MCKTAIALLSVLLSVMFSNTALPAITIVPPDLNVGDVYHLVFVTSGGRDATSSDIAVYNSFVNDEADLVPELVGFTWFAIGSTETVDARDNALVSAPVYRLDGTKVADDFLDMWNGSIDATITINQFGEFNDVFVWTGTLASGQASVNPLGSPFPRIGDPSSIGSAWVQSGSLDQSVTLGFYALSRKLTVPVPEPSSQICVWFMLLCAGTAYGWQRLAGRHSRAPCGSELSQSPLDALDQFT
jgi:hypothetical protein